ncbi:PAS domain-containing sensor histidine kinase [Caldovatus aquaticus]|uniref:histidine kinase n=1 Tax=Caldovatus aquaticus TaxID=2865671 RepID=A0ABS7F0Y3_9PROT|nr:PAS domain-containing sensor histidine kinase [Caldovatus aquaticus]MBW8269261.1 response regulator [Caldovatus aquaticus]
MRRAAAPRRGGDALRARFGAARAEAFRALLAADPSGVAVLDPAGRLVAANPALERLLAGAGDAALRALREGGPAAALFAPEHRAALEARLAAVAAGRAGAAAAGPAAGDGDAPPLELRLAPAAFAPGQAGRVVEVECRPLRRREGVVEGVVLRVADATPRLRLEARLARAGAHEAVARLAGGVAHDFNNLLTAVIGGAEAALAHRPAEPVAAELRQILDGAQRGAALVRRLLAFAGRQTLQPRVLALNDAVRGVAGLVRRLVGDRVRVELALEEPGRWVRVDPVQLDQALLNLAANARDAMPEGGTLRLSTAHATLLRPQREPGAAEPIPPGRWVLLEVADTGHGIPPEVLPRIFEPFFTTRRGQGGTGLGLASVQGVLRQSGGHVTVRSRPGEGTVFRLWLPRHEAEAEAARGGAGPAAAGPGAPAAAAPAGPVLLVEDEAPVRRLAALALRAAGFAVRPVEGAEAALAALDAEGADPRPPAALVSDVSMPGMDGLELARRLRARFPRLPVVLVSGYAAAALGEDLPAEGLRFLAKPYRPQELVAAVRAALAGKE